MCDIGDSASNVQVLRVSFREMTIALTSIDGIIRLISLEAQRTFEQSPCSLLGHNLSELLTSLQESDEFHRFRNLIFKGKEHQSSLLRTKSGVILWIDAYSIPLGSFAHDFYGFASRRQWPVTSKTMNAILGLEVFTTEYHSFLRYSSDTERMQYYYSSNTSYDDSYPTYPYPVLHPNTEDLAIRNPYSIMNSTNNTTTNNTIPTTTDQSYSMHFHFDDESTWISNANTDANANTTMSIDPKCDSVSNILSYRNKIIYDLFYISDSKFILEFMKNFKITRNSIPK